MTTLPDLINVNWYVRCSDCGRSRHVDVEWFKRTREDYGKGRPLSWNRLVCSKCKSRRFTISREDPNAWRSEWFVKELTEQAAFEAKMDKWNSPSLSEWDDYVDELVAWYVDE